MITRKPSGTTTCAKHLIHNINALQREHGTLNLEKRQYPYINYNVNFHVLTIILRQYCDYKKYTTCAKHLIRNINALQCEHGTLNLEKPQYAYINYKVYCYRFYVLAIILRQYCDYKKAIRHYDMCKAFNPQY